VAEHGPSEKVPTFVPFSGRTGMSTDPTDFDTEFVDETTEADLECSHCGGEGLCWDGSDPLGNCPDEMHRCHACNGSGKRRDQVIF
jgi:hypothetical protein